MNPFHSAWTGETVFERTAKGSELALRPTPDLSPLAQRVLLMVTGYTPLQDLMRLLGEGCPDAVFGDLAQQGLIHPVVAHASHADTPLWIGGLHAGRPPSGRPTHAARAA